MSQLEIHFQSDKTNFAMSVANELGLQNITFVDGVLRGTTLGEIQVGGLGTGSVDLDGLGIGVKVDFPSAELSTTLYAKYVSDILVDGVSQKTWSL